MGSADGGHYTAECKYEDDWYVKDDSRSTQASGVSNNYSYVLFFRKQLYAP